MKTIFKNGKIYVEKGNFQEAVLIEDDMILQVGTNEEILKNHADKVIDLVGRTVLPGLNDSHMHISMIGDAMTSCDLTSAHSVEEVIEAGRKFMAQNPGLKYLKGRGWNQDCFLTGEKRNLTRFDLDKISDEIPIVFERVCSHIISGNTKALRILGIDENSKADGGVVELGPDKKPNGVFKENAMRLIKDAIPSKTRVQREAEFLKASGYATSVGITSIQSCDIMSSDFQETFDMISDIYKNEKTKLRYGHQFNFQDIRDFEKYLCTEFITGTYDEKFLSKGALKLFKDGSLGGRTAFMRKEYRDAPGTVGVEALSDEKLQNLCDLAAKNNIRVVTHAIGDGAVESVINAYEKTMKNGKNDLRHGIVHCQITGKEQLMRIARLHIPVMYQPIFLDSDLKVVESRVGRELTQTSYAFNTLSRLGVPISFGTDSPVEDCNPFRNIYCAVTRKGMDMKPEGGFVPEEKMTVEDCVDAYTIKSAYNEFKEHIKGRIREGYLADMTVLNRDIFTVNPDDIKDIKAELTIIGGEIVYET
ncbi:MAG: amidohydrolase [Sedimentibacter sp.]|uniref:amidohydrolase n=1 Tax=Sedimentibacter sp. TaxID=1960295 RepID=UPI003158BB60